MFDSKESTCFFPEAASSLVESVRDSFHRDKLLKIPAEWVKEKTGLAYLGTDLTRIKEVKVWLRYSRYWLFFTRDSKIGTISVT